MKKAAQAPATVIARWMNANLGSMMWDCTTGEAFLHSGTEKDTIMGATDNPREND